MFKGEEEPGRKNEKLVLNWLDYPWTVVTPVEHHVWDNRRSHPHPSQWYRRCLRPTSPATSDTHDGLSDWFVEQDMPSSARHLLDLQCGNMMTVLSVICI